MYNLQPGTGLGRPTSKEIALGLGEWQYVTHFYDRLEIFRKWRGRYIEMELVSREIETRFITAEDLIIATISDTPRISFDRLETRCIEFKLISEDDL